MPPKVCRGFSGKLLENIVNFYIGPGLTYFHQVNIKFKKKGQTALVGPAVSPQVGIFNCILINGVRSNHFTKLTEHVQQKIRKQF